MKNKTLLVLAAGMGSRFGGLKQIEPIGPNGEFIIHYSIYDAIKVGFNKVVFVIKKENLSIFKEKIGKYLENIVEVVYVFQEIENLEDFDIGNIKRIKPWGTSHALLAAKNVINENFLTINADDFYGYDAYKVASAFLDEIDERKRNYGLVAYNLSNTINNLNEVKRGLVKEKNGYITEIIESKIELLNDNFVATPLNEKESFIVNKNDKASMNMICFTKEIFKYLSDSLKIFLNENKNDLINCEYLLPETLSKSIKENNCTVKLLNTTSIWHGITYKEDKDLLVNEINKLIENNIYPKNLF